jgi:hypothetical protein
MSYHNNQRVNKNLSVGNDIICENDLTVYGNVFFKKPVRSLTSIQKNTYSPIKNYETNVTDDLEFRHKPTVGYDRVKIRLRNRNASSPNPTLSIGTKVKFIGFDIYYTLAEPFNFTESNYLVIFSDLLEDLQNAKLDRYILAPDPITVVGDLASITFSSTKKTKKTRNNDYSVIMSDWIAYVPGDTGDVILKRGTIISFPRTDNGSEASERSYDGEYAGGDDGQIYYTLSLDFKKDDTYITIVGDVLEDIDVGVSISEYVDIYSSTANASINDSFYGSISSTSLSAIDITPDIPDLLMGQRIKFGNFFYTLSADYSMGGNTINIQQGLLEEISMGSPEIVQPYVNVNIEDYLLNATSRFLQINGQLETGSGINAIFLPETSEANAGRTHTIHNRTTNNTNNDQLFIFTSGSDKINNECRYLIFPKRGSADDGIMSHTISFVSNGNDSWYVF